MAMRLFNNENPNWIDKLNKRLQKTRAIWFGPILGLMNRVGLTADAITNFRLVAGIIFIAWFVYQQMAATVFIFIVLFLDTLDGSLARKQGRASDRGKFLDILVDHIIYSFIVISLFQLAINPLLIAYNLFIIPVVYLLATLKKEEFSKSDWIIKPTPRLSYLKAFVVAPFFFLIFLDIDYISWGLWLASVVATALSIYYFIFIQLRWKEMYSNR
ncbi:MAG: CDP-alcohol phosphatidyltransferase family protein [bacterium]|nr:CDP-alcohol phosphatidyltransferase family protein [bacterium]